MYHPGLDTIPVRPVTRRITFTRGQAPKTVNKYLQKPGRRPMNRRGYPTMGTPIPVDLSLSPGSFGASILDPIAPLVTSFTPSPPTVPSVVAAPAPSGGFISSIFDSATNFMKNISVSVDPAKTIAAIQQVIKPNQVGYLAGQLQRFGINPSYMGVPVNQYTAQYGYQAAGVNWSQYLPWIIGGGAALIVLPMLMKK